LGIERSDFLNWRSYLGESGCPNPDISDYLFLSQTSGSREEAAVLAPIQFSNGSTVQVSYWLDSFSSFVLDRGIVFQVALRGIEIEILITLAANILCLGQTAKLCRMQPALLPPALLQ
jgi:hypothetical protein